jgi:hypothetical protein
LAVAVIVRSFRARRRGHGWLHTDEKLQSALLQSFDIQVLLGLVLYVVLSPWPRVLLANFSVGVKNPEVRFFAMEHALVMLLSTVVLHVTRVRSKRAPTPALRHQRVFRGTLLTLVLLLAAIPWPGLQHGRPLLRGLTLSGEMAPLHYVAGAPGTRSRLTRLPIGET